MPVTPKAWPRVTVPCRSLRRGVHFPLVFFSIWGVTRTKSRSDRDEARVLQETAFRIGGLSLPFPKF